MISMFALLTASWFGHSGYTKYASRYCFPLSLYLDLISEWWTDAVSSMPYPASDFSKQNKSFLLLTLGFTCSRKQPVKEKKKPAKRDANAI